MKIGFDHFVRHKFDWYDLRTYQMLDDIGRTNEGIDFSSIVLKYDCKVSNRVYFKPVSLIDSSDPELDFRREVVMIFPRKLIKQLKDPYDLFVFCLEHCNLMRIKQTAFIRHVIRKMVKRLGSIERVFELYKLHNLGKFVTVIKFDFYKNEDKLSKLAKPVELLEPLLLHYIWKNDLLVRKPDFST